MKATRFLLFALFSISAIILHASPKKEVSLEGKLNCPYISTQGGTIYLSVCLNVPSVENTKRKPLNLSIVLDRSGSMEDEKKMDYAKKALRSLIDELNDDDIFSLVVYDDNIDVVRSASKVRNKQSIKSLLNEIEPRGSTNLGGGMMEGFQQVEKNLDKEYTNRVILLSDGLANMGITDPYQLQKIARKYRAKSISLTTMGVGLDYNENLMVGLSESGGGNYYFIEHPTSLASIVKKEFSLLSSLVAHNATIELKLGKNVRVKDVIGYEYDSNDGKCNIPLGDLYGNDKKEFTIELEIPKGEKSFAAVEGVLNFESKKFSSGQNFSNTISYNNDAAVREKNTNWDIQAKVDIAQSTRKVENAMKAMDEGRMDDAEQELKSANQALSAAPSMSNASGEGAAMMKEQLSRLRSYKDALKNDDARKAKKSIQYENYNTQKKNNNYRDCFVPFARNSQ